MDVFEAVDMIRAARPDLKKIIRVQEVGPLTKCGQPMPSSLTSSHRQLFVQRGGSSNC